MPQHAHERNNPTPAADQQKRTARFQTGPDEMPSDRPAQLNRVAGLQLIGQEWRHLTVFQAIYRELQRGHFGWGGDRVAPFRTVTILGLEAYVRVLAGQMARPVVDRELNGLHPVRLFTDGDDSRGLPGRWPRNASHRRTVVPGTDHRSCGTRSLPRTLARCLP